jgi:CRISPR/Cas system CMR subunit Cmr4 (Cas7 group RAMP superfamily)
VVVPDALLVKLTFSEIDVVTRIHLNDSKTTTGGLGNMFREELVPAESVFYSLVSAADSSRPTALEREPGTAETIAADLCAFLTNRRLRVGGSETVGRGGVRTTWYSTRVAQGGTRCH